VADRPGLCRFCGCTYYHPCPEGCGWADRKQTLCTACVHVDAAFSRTVREAQRGLSAARRSSVSTFAQQFRHAFFRGFTAGADDERAVDRRNPYAKAPFARGTENPRRRYWQLGYDHARSEQGASATR
jgi:hypothetical protein